MLYHNKILKRDITLNEDNIRDLMNLNNMKYGIMPNLDNIKLKYLPYVTNRGRVDFGSAKSMIEFMRNGRNTNNIYNDVLDKIIPLGTRTDYYTQFMAMNNITNTNNYTNYTVLPIKHKQQILLINRDSLEAFVYGKYDEEKIFRYVNMLLMIINTNKCRVTINNYLIQFYVFNQVYGKRLEVSFGQFCEWVALNNTIGEFN